VDGYQTIAEVAVAVVGFVAIVAAINRDQISNGLERVLAQNVLFEPIAVVMFALLPDIVGASGVEPGLGLRFSLALFAIVHLYLSYWVYTRFRPYLGTELPKFFSLTVIMAAVILCLVQLVSVVFVLPVTPQFLYLVGLYWLLGMCFLNFVMLFVLDNRGA
jgi:hypothetical protein